MRSGDRRGLELTIACACTALLAWTAVLASAQQAPPDSDTRIEQLIGDLGSEEYATREDSTRRLFTLGPTIAPQLRARLENESDPEVQRRLRYILANIVPPRQAVLLIRATPDSGLAPGAVITHVGANRVRNVSELRQLLGRRSRQMHLTLHEQTGPRVAGLIEMRQLEDLSDYVSPRGESLAEAVRLYATGYAEQAYERILELGPEVPQNELSKPLLARIAHTAGDGALALELMANNADSIRATEQDWSSPSFFDLRGPGKAPFHLEWALASGPGRAAFASQNDPDLRIQRILLPANRFAEALTRTVGYWSRSYRDALAQEDGAATVAGNQLAVAAWMLQGLDLRSECCRLIEPRSAILRRPQTNVNKWIRVETDAWLPFLNGDARQALDGFYEDAFDVLQRPPGSTDRHALIRNPDVAARVAMFLYQFPDDERVDIALNTVNHDQHPALSEYLKWMMYALRDGNYEAIKRDLHASLPRVSDEDVREIALAAALLEYVSAAPAPDVMRAARARLAAAPTNAESAVTLAIIDALIHLTDHRPAEAVRVLEPFAAKRETAALRRTAEFLNDPPPTAANHAALGDPILAVPLGTAGRHWLVLARDRRLMRFDAEQSRLTAVAAPTPTWFPNPLTWPWIGRDDESGQAWVYCRRRVIEVTEDGSVEPLRVNIRTDDIPAFDRFVGPHFSSFAKSARAAEHAPAEDGEFLRSELNANREYVADPDLPEVGFIQPTPGAEHVAHVGLRGGAHMLVDTESGRSWTSVWIGSQLGLPSPPGFFARAALGSSEGDEPTLVLMSDQGLIRFDLGSETLTRIPLPGVSPFPPLIPESTPYERRDPRWIYFARTPEDGGDVFRVTVADWSVAPVDMINEALPEHYYDGMLRSEIRAALNRRLAEENLPSLPEFIADAAETVKCWIADQPAP